jgi:hypothetical protein
VPAGTSSLFGSARIVLSEPFGADCIPGGVSPWGLDAGAPPPDPVLIGPVFPCGCVTLPPELVLVDGLLGSPGFDWEKAADAADKAKAVVRAISLRHMSHLRRIQLQVVNSLLQTDDADASVRTVSSTTIYSFPRRSRINRTTITSPSPPPP